MKDSEVEDKENGVEQVDSSMFDTFIIFVTLAEG